MYFLAGFMHADRPTDRPAVQARTRLRPSPLRAARLNTFPSCQHEFSVCTCSFVHGYLVIHPRQGRAQSWLSRKTCSCSYGCTGAYGYGPYRPYTEDRFKGNEVTFESFPERMLSLPVVDSNADLMEKRKESKWRVCQEVEGTQNTKHGRRGTRGHGT